MRILLAFLLATSSLLRPSLVLCVEATGDVRVEWQEAIACCESSEPDTNVNVNAASEDDCDGCLDVLLATHSLASKRASIDVTLLPISVAFELVPDCGRVTAATRCAGRDVAHTDHSSRISTTVIRC